jgi:tetratricopeptide (TPR) repeat protein
MVIFPQKLKSNFIRLNLYVVMSVCVFVAGFASLVSANPLRETFEQGVVAFNQRNFQEAAGHFEKALTFHPGFAEAHFYLGASQKELGNLKQAASELEQAVKFKPAYPLAYEELGKVYYELGDFDTAQEMGLKALELDPQSVSAKLSLGWISLLGKGESAKAVEYFKQIVGENELPYAYLGLGMAYYMNDQRLLVMEMITALRKIEREDFANQLEAIVRSGPYVPSKDGGAPLGVSQRHQQMAVEEIPPLSEHSDIAPMSVRINKNLPQSENFISRSYPENMTGDERIRQLQQKSQEQGLGY